MILWACCLAVEVAAAVLAWRRAGTKSSAEYSKIMHARGIASDPLALLLTFAPASDVAIQLGKALVLDGAARPFVGLARVWYHVETALVLAWPAGLCGAAWAVFGERPSPRAKHAGSLLDGNFGVSFSPRPTIALAWALAVVAVAVAHPLPRGWTAPLLRAWTLLAVVAGVVAVVRAWRSSASWGRSATHHAVLLLLGTEAAVAVVGPYVRDPFADWDAARLLYLVGFAGVCAVLSNVRRRGPASAL